MPDAATEQQIIDRARAGSVAAFDELMRAHQDGLYRFLVMRGAAPADAEDVVQETFLAAYRHLGSYRSRWRFSTWLYTIARRSAARVRSPDGGFHSPDAGQDPEQHLAQEQQRTNLWTTARGVLSREQFSALWLYYAEEFDIREIARVLGRSRAWVKVNLHRSRQRLGDALDDQYLTGRNPNDEPIRT